MVYRVFVEKKEGLANEAKGLLSELKNLLGIAALEDIRLFNRYDAEQISEELFDYAVKTVFSEPQLDIATSALDAITELLTHGLNPLFKTSNKIFSNLS